MQASWTIVADWQFRFWAHLIFKAFPYFPLGKHPAFLVTGSLYTFIEDENDDDIRPFSTKSPEDRAQISCAEFQTGSRAEHHSEGRDPHRSAVDIWDANVLHSAELSPHCRMFSILGPFIICLQHPPVTVTTISPFIFPRVLQEVLSPFLSW